jgi:hypothetical protein
MLIFATSLALAVSAWAADISGKWTGQVPRGGQTVETTFVFDGQGGTLEIADGKITGDTVSFSVTTERGKRTFTGTASANEIKFKREGGQSPSEFTAKRSTP